MDKIMLGVLITLVSLRMIFLTVRELLLLKLKRCMGISFRGLFKVREWSGKMGLVLMELIVKEKEFKGICVVRNVRTVVGSRIGSIMGREL